MKVDSLLQLKGFDLMELEENQMYWSQDIGHLNFNAIAQGYSVDLMCALLETKGILEYYVELGGELKVKGKNAQDQNWRIGIDRPKDENLERELIAILSLSNQSMATSGNYRKYYEKEGKKYSHTINPANGYPVSHSLLSATVVSEDCYRADALATAFMVMGIEKSIDFLRKNPSDQAVLIYEDEKGELNTFWFTDGTILLI